MGALWTLRKSEYQVGHGFVRVTSLSVEHDGFACELEHCSFAVETSSCTHIHTRAPFAQTAPLYNTVLCALYNTHAHLVALYAVLCAPDVALYAPSVALYAPDVALHIPSRRRRWWIDGAVLLQVAE